MARRRRQETRTDSAERFWQWFTPKAELFADLLKQDKLHEGPLMSEFIAHLRLTHPKLKAILVDDLYGPVMLISASGGLVNVSRVLDTVAAAPEMPDWRIFAFQKKLDDDPSRLYCATPLPIEDVGFAIALTNAGYRLTVYTAADPATNPQARVLAETMIDRLFGREIFDEFAEVVYRQAPHTFNEHQRVYALNELADVLTALNAAMQQLTERSSRSSTYHAWR